MFTKPALLSSRPRLQQQPARSMDRQQQQSSSSPEFQSRQRSSSGQMGGGKVNAGNESWSRPRLALVDIVATKSGNRSGEQSG